jgi:hypothetical protein
MIEEAQQGRGVSDSFAVEHMLARSLVVPENCLRAAAAAACNLSGRDSGLYARPPDTSVKVAA